MRARKIIICIDGTGNRVGDNESNILKLYKGLVQSDTQIAHYVPGVGTMDGPRLFGSTLVRKTKALAGLAFGMGLEDDVLDAYRFLCRTYQSAADKRGAEARNRAAMRDTARNLGIRAPASAGTRILAEDDQIYIFGFSRGAYAARILAGFIHNFGLVPPSRLHMITEAFRAYRIVTEQDRGAPNAVVFKALRQYESALRPNGRVPIRCLGLFDTVASMVRFRNPLSSFVKYRSPMELSTHANVMRNASVRIVLHAMAVDERRSMFRALPWVRTDYFGNRFRQAHEKRTQFVRQRWFPGYHSDIGGTPRENFSGIGKITLLWMLDELRRCETQALKEDNAATPLPDGMRRIKPVHGIQIKSRYRRGFLEGRDQKRRTPDGQLFSKPDAMAPTHNSMSLAWAPLEFFPKTTKRRQWRRGRPGWLWYLPLSEPRVIPETDEIDESVHERMRRWRFYRPENVPRP
ncbi:T6SS phospholipase effector Tle1-like catalytic domain-containing protein [Sedimentitalea sp. HM32M-2]|uniref:T6SS phospholipase effector Tle1-like catalytic domain-containing protein n=1 Tax=Sedimentitalea sp. HM32M-2 TaxID=3351566 RepID=UPI00363E3EF2